MRGTNELPRCFHSCAFWRLIHSPFGPSLGSTFFVGVPLSRSFPCQNRRKCKCARKSEIVKKKNIPHIFRELGHGTQLRDEKYRLIVTVTIASRSATHQKRLLFIFDCLPISGPVIITVRNVSICLAQAESQLRVLVEVNVVDAIRSIVVSCHDYFAFQFSFICRLAIILLRNFHQNYY